MTKSSFFFGTIEPYGLRNRERRKRAAISLSLAFRFVLVDFLSLPPRRFLRVRVDESVVRAHDGLNSRLFHFPVFVVRHPVYDRVNDEETSLRVPAPARHGRRTGRRWETTLARQIFDLLVLIEEVLEGFVIGERGHLGLAHACVTPTRRYATDIARDNARASKCACKEEKRDLLKKKRTTTENSEFFEVFF